MSEKKIHDVCLSILLCLAVLVSQSYFIPVFIWSFILLLIVYICLFGLKILKTNFDFTFDYLYIIVLIFYSTRISSIIYIFSSFTCLYLSYFIVKYRVDLFKTSIYIFIIINIISLLFGYFIMYFFDDYEEIFVKSLTNESIRYRGIMMEPNYLGFSISAIYLLILFFNKKLKILNKSTFNLVIILLWIIAILTVSLYAIPCLAVITLLYNWTSIVNKLKIVFFLVFIIIFSLYLFSGRIQQVISGEDNSANLRTWGAISIALSQVDKCGIFGCGLGSGRAVLENEPRMIEFASENSPMLPNMFAGALVEGGYAFALFILFCIISTALLYPNRDIDWRCRLAILFVLLFYASTSSYPYDPQFWAIMGVFRGILSLKFSKLA